MLKAVVLNRIARPVNFLPAPAPASIVGFELFITHFKQHPSLLLLICLLSFINVGSPGCATLLYVTPAQLKNYANVILCPVAGCRPLSKAEYLK